MSGMNEYLAVAYGTAAPEGQTADAADPEKVAHAELFCKLAAENGIDLSTMDDAEAQKMYSAFVTKLAEEEKKEKEEKEHGKEGKENPFAGKKAPPFGKKEEEKEAAARAEFAKQQEFSQKTAEADFIGRQMAHAFAQELRIIGGDTKTASATKAASAFSFAMTAGKPAPTAAAAKVAAASAQPSGKRKEAGALDKVAADLAFSMAVQHGLDKDTIGTKLAALLTLGPVETVKTAGLTDFEEVKSVRALELLEQIGCDVTWTA